MPTNDFLPFATAGGANVLSQAAYAGDAARSAGVIAGTARSALANKSWRQASIMAAMLGQFIGDYGALDALDDGNVANLVRDFARSIQRGTFAYVVATGTANDWTVAPSPALAAYAAGRVLNIIAPATNTSTTVNANISTLGNRRIKKADGTDPAVGDLVSGKVYATIDDGTSIRILTPLFSDARNAPFYGLAAAAAVNNIASGGVPTTVITSYGAVKNQLAGSALASGVLTIGSGDEGVYALNAYVNTNLPKGGTLGTVNPYPVVMTIDVSTDGGSTWTSRGTFQESSGSALIFGPQPVVPIGAITLAVGDKVRVTAGQSSGVTLEFPVVFSAAKLGV